MDDRNDEREARDRDYRLARKRFGVEKITLLVLSFYAAITFCLYRTTAQSFRADQRPWVGVETNVDIPDAERQPDGAFLLKGHLKVKNFGPRVARNVFTVAGGPPTDDSNQVCQTAENDCGSAWSFASGKGQEGWTVTSGGQKFGVVLFPGQNRPEWIRGLLKINQQLPTDVFVPGCIVYFDQFGEKHRTRFCFTAKFDGTKFEDWYQCQVCNEAE